MCISEELIGIKRCYGFSFKKIMLYDAGSGSGVKLCCKSVSPLWLSILCMLQYYIVCATEMLAVSADARHVHSLPVLEVDPGSLVLL